MDHFSVRQPQHGVAATLEPSRACAIVVYCHRVRVPIHFDDQPRAGAEEVDNEVAYGMLSSKMSARHLHASEPAPEEALRIRRIGAEPCSLAWIFSGARQCGRGALAMSPSIGQQSNNHARLHLRPPRRPKADYNRLTTMSPMTLAAL